MSNKIESHNLCTTEEAFEIFQASSMYKENGIASCSDIKPKAVSCDNEIEISSTVDEQVQSVNSSSQVPSGNDTKRTSRIASKKNMSASCYKKPAKTNVKRKYRNITTYSKKKLRSDNSWENGDNKSSSGHHVQEDIAIECEENEIRVEQVSTTQGISESVEEDITATNTNIESTTNIQKSHKGCSRNKRNSKKALPTNKLDLEPINSNTGNKLTKDNVSKVRKRGRPKKILPVIVEATKIAQSKDTSENMSITKNYEESEQLKTDLSLNPTRKTYTRPVGRPPKKKCNEEKVQVETQISMPEPVIVSTSLQPKNETHSQDYLNEVNENEMVTIVTMDCELEKTMDVLGNIVANNDENGPNEDDSEDMSLRKFKTFLASASENYDSLKTNILETGGIDHVSNGHSIKRNSKMPVMSDFEYNIDSIVGESSEKKKDDEEVKQQTACSTAEGSGGRPQRRKGKQNLHYDEGSDEDPFANIELFEDDGESRRSKGKRYFSDEEYIPRKKHGKVSTSETTDSDIDKKEEELRKPRRKQINSKSPKKKGKKNEIDTLMKDSTQSMDMILTPDETSQQNAKDVELCEQHTVIKLDDDKSPPGCGSEFENFIVKKIQGTNLKIKRVSNIEPRAIIPLEIPIMDANTIKKTVEMCSQTNTIKTTTTSVQTSTPYEISMATNVSLSKAQAENACVFLKDIIKTTSELGELMTQKSEDFITKKINTKHITDTLKMDYCVKKSFLLFKLAKHNLMQMEENLSRQYEEFLKENNLLQYGEVPKCITPQLKFTDDDSDCEIIEESTHTDPQNVKRKSQPNFNLKTVFLNKELSIKIAKKPSEEQKVKEKINIKGKNAIWISDSVLVKKVKPTQSFLAQDSRNKKPPDTYVTHEMVRDFFKNYYRQTALFICAPFITTEWHNLYKNNICCNYFYIEATKLKSSGSNQRTELLNTIDVNFGINTNEHPNAIIHGRITCPKTLISLCIQVLHKNMILITNKNNLAEICHKNGNITDLKQVRNPEKLFHLCIYNIRNIFNKDLNNTISILRCNESMYTKKVNSLPTLCHHNIEESFTPINVIENNNIVSRYKINTNDKCTKVKSLFSLCMSVVSNTNFRSKCNVKCFSPNSLKHIAYSSMLYFMTNSKDRCTIDLNVNKGDTLSIIQNTHLTTYMDLMDGYGKKPLLQEQNNFVEFTNIFNLKTLFKICFEKLSLIFNETQLDQTSENNGIQINSVKTVPEEVFLSFQNESLYSKDMIIYDNDETNVDVDNMTENYYESAIHSEECNWETKQPIKEFPYILHNSDDGSNLKTLQRSRNEIDTVPISQVKIEPMENDILHYEESPLIKIEMEENLEETNFLPQIENIQVAKQENVYDSSAALINEVKTYFSNNKSIIDEFNELLNQKQMVYNISNNNIHEEKVFSQSSLRVRRQYEPDSDIEPDNTMSLLVPQTYESINIDLTKNSLIENRSTDKKIITQKRTLTKKKFDKGKAKQKSAFTKKDKVNVQEIKLGSKVDSLNEKMHNNIIQEEKKSQSSESDSENVSLMVWRERKTRRRSVKESKMKNNAVDNEIQCNNVDSTQNISDNVENKTKEKKKEADCSNGNENELWNYNEYVNDFYNNIKCSKESYNLNDGLRNVSNSEQCNKLAENLDQSYSPAINPDEPVELLQCEPTLSFFGSDVDKDFKVNANNKETDKCEEVCGPNYDKTSTPFLTLNSPEWKCYPVDSTDTKLYQQAVVILEKLPERFVETYFKYQDISYKCKDDIEVGRLTNLQSLHLLKGERLQNSKSTSKSGNRGANKIKALNCNFDLHPSCLNESIDGQKLTASQDGKDNFIEVLSTRMLLKSKILAKRTLLKEDCDNLQYVKSIKQVSEDIEQKTEYKNANYKSIETLLEDDKLKIEDSKSTTEGRKLLLLTAEKVMSKDLTVLHTHVVLHDDKNDSPFMSTKKRYTKKIFKTSENKDEIKMKENSSSEEEKQWVTTKEKLLKKFEKKQENSREEDAKRAKLVNEFIERCEAPQSRTRQTRSRRLRSRKNFWERQKQLSVLSKELTGEFSAESLLPGKKCSQSFGKGRRNIRKVIDKKSLARSTVIANMEEFERKRRLLQRHTRLRELLGCEEGVNVLVINDEVCLEYDFEQSQPVVSVHPFFTKVMKAHQYEGVKFMWDACFDSLAMIEAGHPGSGCILAHCMGLGKTLQVLALLHTVLTHPRAGMQRVLVCCPLSTVLNWVDEIHKWMGPVTDKIRVFELSKLKKTYERAYQLEDWYNGGGIFIIGYELFRNLTTLDPILDEIRPTIINKIRTALLDPGPDIIVCDEGHLLKNDSSVLAVAMSRVATKRRIVLTGTPMQNNLREYYCMVNFVKPNLLGRYSEYSNRFENPIMNGQHRDSGEEDIKLMKARTHILHKVLEGCLQRQEASVLYPYLPKKHEYTVFIPLTKCQSDLYKHYLRHYTRQAKHSTLRNFHILQKIWTHPHVLHHFEIKRRGEINDKKGPKLEDDLACEDPSDSEDSKPSQTEVWWLQYLEGGDMLNSLESSNKFLAVFRILDECVALEDKLLIFSTSLFTMDALEYFLKNIKKWSLGREYYRLDGSVPPEVRQKWCREFNAPANRTTKLFLISTRAGSLGLNMTAANRVIILDTSWNPAHDIQSIFRVYRFGQRKDCYIYRLVALGTMEQKIYERSVTKQAVACRVVDEQQIDRHYNMDELTELYKFDETGAGVPGGVAVGVTDVVLLRVARDAPLHAVHEHDSLLRGSAEQQLPEHERDAAWLQFEQEQADTQMQNLGQSSLKTPTKQLHGHDYSKLPSQLPDIINNEMNEKPSNEKDKLKPKKGRTTSFKDRLLSDEEDVKSEETTPIVTDKEKEQEIHDVKQDHQNNIEDTNEANVIDNLRKAIELRLKDGTFNSDHGLADSPAKVLHQSDPMTQPIEERNELNEASKLNINRNNECSLKNKSKESENSINNIKRKRTNKNRKERKRYRSKENKTRRESDDNTIEKKKRKDAFKVNEHMGSLDLETNSTQDDNDDWSIEDNNSTLILKMHRKAQTGSCNEVVKLTPVYEKSSDNVEEPQGMDSILLSDEDDAIIIEPTESETVTNAKNKNTEPTNEQNKQIPLHKTLLNHINFVKIVAHTYLVGNPKLDDDAALLAARYSTQKAVKEFERTGKEICSGPIYDIAYNTIGKDKLMALHNRFVQQQKQSVIDGSNTNKSEEDTSNQLKCGQNISKHTRFDKRKESQVIQIIDDENEVESNDNKSEPLKKSVIAKQIEVRDISSDSDDDLVLISAKPINCEQPKNPLLERPQSKTENKSLQSIRDQSKHTKTMVVPIQLFKNKRNSTPQPHRESTASSSECILPDDEEDDDVCAVVDPQTTISKQTISQTAIINSARLLDSNKGPDPQTIYVDSDEDEDVTVTNEIASVGRNDSVNVSQITSRPTSTTRNCKKRISSNVGPLSTTEVYGTHTVHTSPDKFTGKHTSDRIPKDDINKCPINQKPKPSDTQNDGNITIELEDDENEQDDDVSSIDDNYTPSCSYVKKLCKPGDIVRMKGNGEVVVINKHTASVTTTTKGNVTRKLSSPETNAGETLDILMTEGVIKETDKVKNTKQPCVDTARTSSSENPLSIINNVVHIQANNRYMQTNENTVDAQKDSSFKTFHNTTNEQSVNMLDNTCYVNNKNNSQGIKSNTISQQQTCDVVLNSIDLACKDAGTGNNKTVKGKNVAFVSNNELKGISTLYASHKIAHNRQSRTVVGAAKEIIIARTGDKASIFPPVNLPGGTSRKTLAATPKVVKINDIKKRPTPTEPGTAKKMKSDSFQPLTLKDFNIDDIDDIIELE